MQALRGANGLLNTGNERTSGVWRSRELRCAARKDRRPERHRKEDQMAWTTPRIVEVTIGMEVTSYESAE
jgi:coenzyme PQQ precursor peptide PqqA